MEVYITNDSVMCDMYRGCTVDIQFSSTACLGNSEVYPKADIQF